MRIFLKLSEATLTKNQAKYLNFFKLAILQSFLNK